MSRALPLFLVLALVLLPGPARPDAPPAAAPLRVGDVFPELRGEFLNGREAVLPAAARGRLALVALGFTYDSRTAVEGWTGALRKEFGADSSITWYEVPVIGGFGGQVAKPFIRGGMRDATPKAFHENVITVFGGVDPWKKRMGYREAGSAKHNAYMALLDREGRVAWIHSAPWQPEAFAGLAAAIRRTRVPSP